MVWLAQPRELITMASNSNGGSIILSITARKYASYDPPDNPCKIINKGFSSSLIKSSLGFLNSVRGGSGLV